MNEPPFFHDLRQRIFELGGLFNAHLHLDRAGTLEETLRQLSLDEAGGFSHLSLSRKHSIIPAIHDSSCYDEGNLEERVSCYLDLMQAVGTTRADTVVDVTADRVGLSALECLQSIKERRKNQIDLRVGAYSPLGFRNDEPKRWELLVQAVETADFIGSLPERDDREDYPAHIGFDDHCRRVLQLCGQTSKPIHIHADQKNHPFEGASERVLRIVRELDLTTPHAEEPRIWLVHVISPSTYDEMRFRRLVDDFVELNIGVICCPSAAISMRQIRPLLTPTGNSIARVLDFLAAGVPVRVGSDNIGDITSPAGTTDLLWELFLLCNAMRYYDPGILAKLGAGKPLDPDEVDRLRFHLLENDKEMNRIAAKYPDPS